MITEHERRLFESPRLTQLTLHFVYSTVQDLHSKKKIIDQMLSGNYFSSESITGPGEVAGDVPVFSLSSQHGFSNILIGSESTVLTVQLSETWQRNLDRSSEYVIERGKLIRSMVDELGIQPFFTGLGMFSIAHAEPESRLLAWLRERVNIDSPLDHLHELQMRLSTVEDSVYYVNTSIRNYRLWDTAPFSKGIVRFSSVNQIAQGVEFNIEINDRYAFNENPSYFSPPESVAEVVSRGFRAIQSWHSKVEDVT